MVDVKFHEVVVDCANPPTLAAWWAGFTGYTLRTTDPEWSVIVAPERALIIAFQKVPEGKVVKNRVHLDFAAPDEEAAAKEIEAMGATRRWVSENPDDPFVVLADPEGNEFCIVRSA